jgi:threonine dehydrogenase-like Zn-dependent dehydrogenase
MRATVTYAAGDVCSVDVPDPSIADPTDAIIRVTGGFGFGLAAWAMGRRGA